MNSTPLPKGAEHARDGVAQAVVGIQITSLNANSA
jgi:hypothetical protein